MSQIQCDKLYLSRKIGSTDFHVAPFWKQWTALIQVNVEKNKHKHKHNGIYVLPAPPFYYPTNDNYGFYVPHNYGGLSGGLVQTNNFQHPMPYLFDEYKPPTTLV